MKNTYVTCDGCGSPWDAAGNGGTPPGREVHLYLGGATFEAVPQVLHFCKTACIHLWSAPDHERVRPWPEQKRSTA